MAGKYEPRPRSTTVVPPHVFAANVNGPRDHRGDPIECTSCPFLKWNAIHKSSSELVADLPETSAEARAIEHRIMGESE